MRVLHTSDWHLGHTLHEQPRTEEHAAFLSWLIQTILDERVDALLIAGDLFDSANPPASAQQAWYGFLAELRRRAPRVDVVAIGGNHDSAARLDAPDRLLRALNVRVVGGLPRRDDGALDLDRLLVPIHDRRGEVAAWVAAVPFLRPIDLPPSDAEDPLIDGVRAIYEDVILAARARRGPGQAILAMGHCYMTGGAVSELSERKILGGHQHALPIELFPDDVTYVALGHLHLAQRVGGRDRVRYSGSPLPLSFGEVGYPHQVAIVELKGPRLVDVRPALVPRAIEMRRVSGNLAEVLRSLAELEEWPGDAVEWRRPVLQVEVTLGAPEPGLRRQIEDAVEGKAARLLQLATRYAGDSLALADAIPHADLGEISPEQVFARAWRRRFEGDPPGELVAMFHELVEAAHKGGERR